MIATSPDGQWAAVRRGREISLLAGGQAPATGRVTIDSDDADLVIVGPPSVLVVVSRGAAGGNHVVLYQPPYLDPVARLELETAMRVVAVTGPRIVLSAADGKLITIVRIAGRALSTQVLDPGSPIEFAVGLERNQVLFGLPKKLEAWDAVSGRPLLRMQLQLPPPPRTIGPAHGHVWATRPGNDDIVVCRLSDGRPFRHQLGATIDQVAYHPASPLLVLATPRGLVRLHCFAHTLTMIDAPWRPGVPLAQLVVGDDISLLGLGDGDDEPWRVPIGGAGAPAVSIESTEAPAEPLLTAADKLRAMRERTSPEAVDPMGGPPRPAGRAAPARDAATPIAPTGPGPRHAAPIDPTGTAWRKDRGDPDAHEPGPRLGAPAGLGRSSAALPGGTRDPRGGTPAGLFPPRDAARELRDLGVARGTRTWREPLVELGAELARGSDAELPVIAADTELGQLAQRLGLSGPARRAAIALYSAYLVGEPALSIARLAQLVGDWTEPLGKGDLSALALVVRRGGKVRLRRAVTELLDGAPPCAIRVLGEPHAPPRYGIVRLSRDGRSDETLATEVAAEVGRIAVIEGDAARGVLEAQLYGATAVALVPPTARPSPWPRDAALIVVADASPPAWVAALPSFTAA